MPLPFAISFTLLSIPVFLASEMSRSFLFSLFTPLLLCHISALYLSALPLVKLVSLSLFSLFSLYHWITLYLSVPPSASLTSSSFPRQDEVFGAGCSEGPDGHCQVQGEQEARHTGPAGRVALAGPHPLPHAPGRWASASPSHFVNTCIISVCFVVCVQNPLMLSYCLTHTDFSPRGVTSPGRLVSTFMYFLIQWLLFVWLSSRRRCIGHFVLTTPLSYLRPTPTVHLHAITQLITIRMDVPQHDTST